MNSLIGHSFLQTDLWGSFRESQGWHAHKVGSTLVLERPLPLGKSFLYSPEVNAKPELLLELLPEIFTIGKRRSSIVYRLELLVEQDTPLAEEWNAALGYALFTKAFESVQPDDRQIIPLTGNEDDVLAQMKQKGRYNIRLAEKSGVLVRETSPTMLRQDVATFYKIFQDTAKRDKFSVRSQAYFDGLTDLLYQHNCGRVFVATHNDRPLAAAIISLYDGMASYLYGASSSQDRHLMAPYALHWTIMQWAIAQEAKAYDMLAIRPPSEKKHAYDGITRFKQQFGGQDTHLLGSWDLPLEGSWYTLFKFAEQLRRHG